jgi:hypothetical protein
MSRKAHSNMSQDNKLEVKMKKRLMALFMVLVLCMTMVLTGCKDDAKTNDDDKGADKKTEVTLDGAIEKTVNAMLGAENDSVPFLENALSEGKITIALGDQLENVLYLDSSKKAFANTLSLSAEGQKVNLGIYGKDKEIAIAAPELLGDTVYGINLSTLLTDLKGSAIWSLMGTDYDTFMSEYSDQIEQILDMTKGMDENAINKMVEDLSADISEILKDVETTTKEEEVEVYGKKVKAVVITYHMEKEDIEKLMNVMIDWMEDVMSGVMDGLETIVDDSVDLEGVGSVEEMISQLRTEMETAFEDVEIEGDFYVYINAKTQYVMQMGVEVTATVEGVTGVADMAFVLGEDPTNSDKYALVMEVDANGEKQTMEISFSIDEKTEGDIKTTTFIIAADIEGEREEFVITFSHDQKENKYELSLEVDGTEITALGKLEATDTKLHFTIDEIEADGETMPLGLAITIEASADGMPEMPAYSNILKLSEDELMALLETLGQIAPEAPDYPSYPIPTPTPNPGNPGASAPERPEVGAGDVMNGSVTAYDKNGIKVSFTGLKKDVYGDYKLSYEITNNTKGKISFSTDNCVINGITTNMFIFEEVPAGETVTGEESIFAEDLAKQGISSIKNIACYDGEIMDTKDYDWSYPVGFELDCGDPNYVENIDMSGEVIYEGHGIKLIYKGVQDDGYGDKVSTILFVNNSDKHVALDLDDFVVNGKEVDKFGYGYAYAGTVSYVTNFWFESDIEEVGGKLENMTFIMTIENMLSYEEFAEDINVSFDF